MDFKKLAFLCFLAISPLTSFAFGTHYVRTYTRTDGTIVQGHQAGNPNSGVHCYDNVCS
jgi:hypothetical protein